MSKDPPAGPSLGEIFAYALAFLAFCVAALALIALAWGWLL